MQGQDTHSNAPCNTTVHGTFTHKWVMSIYEFATSQVWMSHVQTKESCLDTNSMSHTYEWVMSHIWMSHVIRMNELCHAYEWVMSHVWMSHVTHMNESCHTYEWVMSHIWMSHVIHMSESCHSYEWVISHIWMSQVTHMNESCHTYEWVIITLDTMTCSWCSLEPHGSWWGDIVNRKPPRVGGVLSITLFMVRG